jgi:predicted dehydrogenase
MVFTSQEAPGMASPVRLALVGAGYWGVKLARNIADSPRCELVAICDPDAEQLAAVGRRHPGARLVPTYAELLDAGDIDGVVLATPAGMHAEQARLALEADAHVFVEKPLALDVVDCDRLIDLAAARKRTLMVGHTFLYSAPVQALRALIAAGELGRVLYVYAQRLNLGAIRDDHSALWDLGPHDMSILVHLLGMNPERISARQFPLLGGHVEDVAFVCLEFPGGIVGHVHDSRLDPRKVRQITVVGDRKMAVYDDTDVESPLRIYDKGIDRTPIGSRRRRREVSDGFGEFKFEVRSGDVLCPKIPAREPLRDEVEHFANCVRTGATPLTDGVHGRSVVAILEAAERSSSRGGIPVVVDGVRVPVVSAA